MAMFGWLCGVGVALFVSVWAAGLFMLSLAASKFVGRVSGVGLVLSVIVALIAGWIWWLVLSLTPFTITFS